LETGCGAGSPGLRHASAAAFSTVGLGCQLLARGSGVHSRRACWLRGRRHLRPGLPAPHPSVRWWAGPPPQRWGVMWGNRRACLAGGSSSQGDAGMSAGCGRFAPASKNCAWFGAHAIRPVRIPTRCRGGALPPPASRSPRPPKPPLRSPPNANRGRRRPGRQPRRFPHPSPQSAARPRRGLGTTATRAPCLSRSGSEATAGHSAMVRAGSGAPVPGAPRAARATGAAECTPDTRGP
jgi:hypothetical protein